MKGNNLVELSTDQSYNGEYERYGSYIIEKLTDESIIGERIARCAGSPFYISGSSSC